MPKSFRFIIGGQSYSFTADDRIFANLPVPDHTRQSTQEAVFFRELETWLSLRARLSHPFSDDDHLMVLKLLYDYSNACKQSHRFIAELFDVVNLKEGKNEIDNSVVEAAQKRRLKPVGFMGKPSQVVSELNQTITKIKNNQPVDCYPYFILDSVQPSDKAFFKKINPGQNNQAPQDYLRKNDNAHDRLSHVRACEDPFCSLNPDNSERTHGIDQNVGDEVIRYAKGFMSDKTKTIYYGGFASGFLLRDLRIIKKLIDEGYHHFKFLFVDKMYATWMQAITGDKTEFNLKEQIEINMVNHAFFEFASWVAANVGGSQQELEFRIFASVDDAIKHLSTSSDKLTILTAQDYFTPDYQFIDKQFATVDAHGDFMRLAKCNPSCAFFESIKAEEGVYLHSGFISAKGDYIPLSTTTHPTYGPFSYVYANTPLCFFVKAIKDNPFTEAKNKVAKKFEFKNGRFNLV